MYLVRSFGGFWPSVICSRSINRICGPVAPDLLPHLVVHVRAVPHLLAQPRRCADQEEQAEQHLIDTGLDYTIIRPGGLKEAEATGNGMLTEDSEAMGIITRADLAKLLVQCIDDKETIGKTYSAVDSEMTWPWDMWSSS